MTIQFPASVFALAAALSLTAAASVASAQTAAPTAKKPAHAKVTKKAAAKKAAAPVEVAPPAADADQISAAEKVYYGLYACEFKDTVDIVASPKYPAYVDVKHEKGVYLMKPVLSSTGAIRLEDVKGETLMVQISSKSMLLNVKTGHRIVDDCISPKQRELIEEARVAKAAEAASAPAATTSDAAAPAADKGAAPASK